MIEPDMQGKEFLADVEAVAEDHEELHLWWLGQSGFLVHWQGSYLLLDPYLSDSLTEKYEGTDKPHLRMTERVIEPARLDFITAVTSSHNHTDHLDAATLQPLLEVNPVLVVVVPRANLDFAAERLGVAPDRLTPASVGSEIRAGPFTLQAVPAAHEELERNEHGDFTHVGYVVQAGPWTLYHSGDTVRYPGMAERLRPFEVDVAILPINGADPARGVSGNLSGPEAVKLAQDIGAHYVIPCHFEMFEFNTVSPDAFVEAAVTAGQGHTVLEAGTRWSTLALPPSAR